MQGDLFEFKAAGQIGSGNDILEFWFRWNVPWALVGVSRHEGLLVGRRSHLLRIVGPRELHLLLLDVHQLLARVGRRRTGHEGSGRRGTLLSPCGGNGSSAVNLRGNPGIVPWRVRLCLLLGSLLILISEKLRLLLLFRLLFRIRRPVN